VGSTRSDSSSKWPLKLRLRCDVEFQAKIGRMAKPVQFASVRFEPGRYLFASWQNFTFLVWLSSADEPDMKAMSRFTDEHLQRYEKYSSVHIIEEDAGVPTAAGRAELQAIGRRNGPRVVSVGALLPSSSLFASLLTAFLRGLRMLLRGNVDICVEQDVLRLVSWMAPRHAQRSGTRVAGADLLQAIAEVRALAAARTAEAAQATARRA